MFLSDKEAYENIRDLVLVGKYYQAYEVCKSHQCKDKILDAKINCAKYILRFISSFTDIHTTSFKWITSMQKEADIPTRDYKHELSLNFLANQISEIRELFDLE
jgi:hypothetical protein